MSTNIFNSIYKFMLRTIFKKFYYYTSITILSYLSYQYYKKQSLATYFQQISIQLFKINLNLQEPTT